MKTWLAIFCLTFAICANAQNSGFAALRAAQAQQLRAEQNRQAQWFIQRQIDELKSSIERKQRWLDSAKTNAAKLPQQLLDAKKKIPENPWREINGAKKYVKTDPDFQAFLATAVQTVDDGILIKMNVVSFTESGPNFSENEFFLKNFPFRCADGDQIQFRAVKSGLHTYAGQTFHELDYGIPCERPKNAAAIELAAQQLNDSDNEQITNAIKKVASAQADLDAAKKALQDFLGAMEATKQKAKADADVVTNMAGFVQDIRVVNGQEYDVTTSKEWVSITIPTGTGLLNANQIHFTGTVHPIDINLAFRVASAVRRNVYETVVIHNFPYDPKYFYNVSPTSRGSFQASFPLIQTRLPLTLRVFPLSHPSTNWNALGEMKITPARPDFDFGLQEAAQKTLDETLDDQRRAAAEKADDTKTAVQARVLKSNQEDADKGDEYGLLRMGERYRDGDGVEKDLAKAKDYLTKAAAAGSQTAADALSKLNQVSTNSPATQ